MNTQTRVLVRYSDVRVGTDLHATVQEYQELWRWTGEHVQRLNDDEDGSAQKKWQRLLAIEEEFLARMSAKELVALRN